jgi:hypothetical protein
MAQSGTLLMETSSSRSKFIQLSVLLWRTVQVGHNLARRAYWWKEDKTFVELEVSLLSGDVLCDHRIPDTPDMSTNYQGRHHLNDLKIELGKFMLSFCQWKVCLHSSKASWILIIRDQKKMNGPVEDHGSGENPCK